MITVTSKEEAIALAQAVENNDEVLRGREEEAIEALEFWVSNGEQVESVPELQPTEFRPTPSGGPEEGVRDVSPPPPPPSLMEQIGSGILATADVAAVLGTGAISGPLAGATGAVTNILTLGDNNAGKAIIDAVNDALTFTPRTEGGQKALETIAPVLQYIEDSVDWVTTTLSLGNPIAATTIKTALLGIPEIIGGKFAIDKRLDANLRSVRQQAVDLGINPTIRNMRGDVVEAAARMVPAERAANAGALRQAMQEARDAQKKVVDAKFKSAREGRAFLETSEVKGFSKAIREDLLEEGFDIQDFPTVQNRLTDLAKLEKPSTGPNSLPVVNLKEIERVRRNINRNRGRNSSEDAALNMIKRRLDDFVDDQFNRDAILGDPAAVQRWKDARSTFTRYKRNFSDDKTIVQLIDMDATPTMIRQWMMGASAMGAKGQVVSTIQTMKRVLGTDHPAINGIKSDFLFELAAPLLQEKPNFSMFVRNWDKMVRANPEFVKELGLNTSDMAKLRNFATVADSLPPFKRRISPSDITTTLSRLMVGSGLAKKAVKVNLGRNMMNIIFGVDVVTKKQIWGRLTDVEFDKPSFPKTRTAASIFIASQAIETLQRNKDERDRRKQGR